jgi:GDP-D-mannose 3',5'-epimerase
MYIDDCIFGTRSLMASEFTEPINIGSDQLVTINELVDMVERIAGIRVRRSYLLDAPKGVRGRNSDNSLIRTVLGWEPAVRLEAGLEQTYRWIYDQLASPRPVLTGASQLALG